MGGGWHCYISVSSAPFALELRFEYIYLSRDKQEPSLKIRLLGLVVRDLQIWCHTLAQPASIF